MGYPIFQFVQCERREKPPIQCIKRMENERVNFLVRKRLAPFANKMADMRVLEMCCGHSKCD